MGSDIQAQARAQKVAQLELGIWEALIGAQGSPSIQKFVIQQRLYGFAKVLVNISRPNQTQEMRQAHNLIKQGAGAKLKQFIDFIEGGISLEEAIQIKNELQDILDNDNIVQLASA